MKYPHLSPSERRRGLWRKCMAIVVRDRKADAEHAAWWIKTYCRHWATVGHDTQTMDNLNDAERTIARQHLGTLRRLGRLREGGFRGNFEVMDSPEVRIPPPASRNIHLPDYMG